MEKEWRIREEDDKDEYKETSDFDTERKWMDQIDMVPY
jgi:hypothetical protein